MGFSPFGTSWTCPRTNASTAPGPFWRSLALPADQCGGLGTDYLSALSTYLHHHTPEGAAA
ncbi:hypothetical protein ACFZB6_29390 [Streptomyces syringium]|uniref:hypothetical protein n=1 Tax=Streptomyces syringium TaxID=76729 RepID=UPI0036F16C96